VPHLRPLGAISHTFIAAVAVRDLKLGMRQVVDTDSPVEWRRRLEKAHEYLIQTVAKDPLMRTAVLHRCKNRHEKCAFWATRGT
jgi:hypothetical protein